MDISRDQLAKTLCKVYLFHRLQGAEMEMLLTKAELVFFPAGKMIYLENARAEALYIVFEGQVEILKERKQTLLHKNLIKPLHAFGEDIFTNAARRTSARALEDTILIKVEKDVVHTIAGQNAEVHRAVLRQFASYNYLIDSRFMAIADETLCFISPPHPIAVVWSMVVTLAAVVAAGVLFIIFRDQGIFSTGLLQWLIAGVLLTGMAWMLYVYLEWANDFFFFTDKRASSTWRKYLLFEERKESPLNAVESVQVRKSMIGRALDFGDLDINTYTGSTRIHQVPAVENALALLQFLVQRRRGEADHEVMDAFRNDLHARIDPHASSGVDHDGMDDLRQEKDGKPLEGRMSSANEPGVEEIILRKHFTVLISKTFIPILLLLSHFLFYLFARLNQLGFAENSVFIAVMAADSVILFLWAAYRYADWHNDRFIITDEMLIDIDRKPFGTEEKRSAPLERIQSIRYKKNGAFGLLFNFGTVFIRIGDEEFTFDDLYRPAQVTQLIFDAKDSRLEKEKVSRQLAEQKRALDWIEAYHHLQKQEKDKKNDIE
jgi:uncharacterized membrane protein YdbT with pleckstrin-like domain